MLLNIQATLETLDSSRFIFSCFDDRNEHIDINIAFLKITNQEQFEDTKWTTRICKSKDRQHNGEKTKD